MNSTNRNKRWSTLWSKSRRKPHSLGLIIRILRMKRISRRTFSSWKREKKGRLAAMTNSPTSLIFGIITISIARTILSIKICRTTMKNKRSWTSSKVCSYMSTIKKWLIFSSTAEISSSARKALKLKRKQTDKIMHKTLRFTMIKLTWPTRCWGGRCSVVMKLAGTELVASSNKRSSTTTKSSCTQESILAATLTW